MPIVDPSTIPDDTLRPWIVDDEYDSKVLDAMSAFDETYAQTSYNRNAGQHGDSDLDKIRHDDLMEFSETISGRVSGGEDKEGEGEEEKTDYMMVHDDDSVGSNGGEPYMLPFDDESNAEGEELDSVPLGEDDDILKMTSSMNNIDQKRFMKTRTLRLLMEKEKKKREDDFRSGSIRHLHTTSLQKIPSSKYMPTHKTRVYKEWVDAQRELRKETMKEKAYLLDRPTTAFINSLIDKERDILAESFSKQEFTRQAAADDKAAKTIQLEELNITTQKMKETNNQKRCLERFNRLYPDLKVNIPRSPISSSRPVTSSGESSRPATSDGFKMSRPLTGDVDSLNNNDGKHSPLRPLTTENKNKHFGRTKPTFHDRRCDMTLVLGLKGDQDSFPTSNNDSIPSNRSAIVKYRTPREQMLDSLTVSSKAEEDEAKRKATKRVKAASSALKEIKNKNSSMDSGRFSRPATPLDNLGITTSSPATNSQSVFVRPPKPKVKQLRDLMRTTSGVDSRMFNKGLQTKIAYDPQAERQKAVRAALETKIIDQTDSTTEALINPGFFEAMGPDRIYLSETKKFHSADQRHAQQLSKREKAHITEADDIKKWAMESLHGGRQLFHSGGGGFHYS